MTRKIGFTIAALLLGYGAYRMDAITYGFADTTNAFRNAGAFIVKSPTTGNIFPICSGALIAPTVFFDREPLHSVLSKQPGAQGIHGARELRQSDSVRRPDQSGGKPDSRDGRGVEPRLQPKPG
jgi:hypothetical protein